MALMKALLPVLILDVFAFIVPVRLQAEASAHSHEAFLGIRRCTLDFLTLRATSIQVIVI